MKKMTKHEELFMKLHVEHRVKRTTITVPKILRVFIVESMNRDPEKYADILADTAIMNPDASLLNHLVIRYVLRDANPDTLKDVLRHFSPKRYQDILKANNKYLIPLTAEDDPEKPL